MYVTSALYVPPNIIAEVNKLLVGFLWPKKVHVKFSTIIAPIVAGGLRMPVFESKVKASKIMWAQRLQQNSHSANFSEIFGLPKPFKEMCKFNYDMCYLPDYISPFYAQILEYYYELQNKSAYKPFEIRQECIWFNKLILVGNRPVYNKHLYDKGIFLYK